MIKFIGFWLLVIAFLFSCNSNNNGKQTVTVYLSHAKGSTAYLERKPEKNVARIILDSAFIKENHDTISLALPISEESVYVVRIKGEFDYSFEFVNDVNNVKVIADVLFKNKLSFLNSPSNSEYLNFINTKTAEDIQAKKSVDSFYLIKKSLSSIQADAVDKIIDSIQIQQYKKTFDYAERTKSPANFLRVFPSLEFFNDTFLLATTVKKATQKFANHSKIKNLYKRTEDYLNILRYEFQVGDTLPPFLLPNNAGQVVSTANFYSKYILLDFWSSVNPDNRSINTVYRKLHSATKNRNFVIVSIAVEPGTQQWAINPKTIYAPWPQLIDSLGWTGDVVKTTAIDSIPYNFLLKPGGVIIAKGIETDSIYTTVLKNIK
jgi:hypothetical protein